MSHACIALLLATTLAAPEAGPVEVAPAPVAAPAPAPTPTVTLAPASTFAVGPAPAAVAPPPPPIDPERVRAQRSADGLVITGAVVASLGAGSLVLVAWPSHALYRRSLEKAESVRWVTQQDRFIDDARHHRSIMLASAGIGAGLAAVGTVILATGLSRRARLRNSAAATLSVAPAVGGGTYGVGASMRF